MLNAFLSLLGGSTVPVLYSCNGSLLARTGGYELVVRVYYFKKNSW